MQEVPVNTDVQTLAADEITRRIEDGNLDIGITYVSSVEGESLEVFPLINESYVALSYDEIGERLPDAMTWAELSDHDLCLPTANVPARSRIEKCLNKNCEEWHTAIETDCWLTMMQAVRRNGVIGIAPGQIIGILTIPYGTSVISLPNSEESLELAVVTGESALNEPALGRILEALPKFKDYFVAEATAFVPME